MKKTMIAALVAVSGVTAVHAATITQENPNGSRSDADWNQTATFNANNPGPTWTGAVLPTAGNDYVANARVNSPTSATPVSFPGDSLELSGATAQLQMRSTSSANTVTIDSLILNGGTVVPNQDTTGSDFATLDGNISVIADSFLANIQNTVGNARNADFASLISGSSSTTLTLQNNAALNNINNLDIGPTAASLRVSNAGNSFAGTWNILYARAIFANAGSVGSGNFNVNADSYLRIDETFFGESMTVVNDAQVEVGAGITYALISMTANGSPVAAGSYTAAELNTETGSTIFSGAGDILIDPNLAANIPQFIADPIVTSNATFGVDYAALGQTLAGSATNDFGDTMSYAVVGGPAWLVVAPNGALSGTPTEAGLAEFTVKATTGIYSAQGTLQLTVDPVGNPPQFTSDPVVTASGVFSQDYALQSQSLTNNVTDADTDIAALTFAKTDGAAWLNVASNGVLSGVCNIEGTNSFTVTVDDGNGNTVAATLLIFVAPQPPQLLHLWRFDDGAGDVAVDSAGSNDGVITNATWASDAERASYLSFNGLNSSVNPSVTMAVPTADNGETWACWVLDPSTSENANDIIMGNRGVGNADFGKIIPSPDTGGRLGYRNDVLEGYDFNTGNATIVRDVWTHVAFVRDGSNATFYVNGVLVNDTPYVLSIDNASALPFFMGGEPGLGDGEHFEGGIDEVVLYNYALTASQVLELKNGNIPGADVSSVITAYSFDPAGTSSLSFTGAKSTDYVIKSTGNLPIGGFTTVTPSAVTTGSLSGDVITTDAAGAATAEFSETAPAQFYKVESAQ